MEKKTTKIRVGWKKTAFGQHYCHYFNKDYYLPVCRTSAIFTTSDAEDRPRGYICKRCLELSGVSNAEN